MCILSDIFYLLEFNYCKGESFNDSNLEKRFWLAVSTVGIKKRFHVLSYVWSLEGLQITYAELDQSYRYVAYSNV